MNLLHKALNRVLNLFGRRLPPEDDPHSYVMAPKKPRPPYRSAPAVADCRNSGLTLGVLVGTTSSWP
jgi:hypothetical protein